LIPHPRRLLVPAFLRREREHTKDEQEVVPYPLTAGGIEWVLVINANFIQHSKIYEIRDRRIVRDRCAPRVGSERVLADGEPREVARRA